ncbi:MAG TPA: helix-turn-helix domain-containing protein [Solirubrobacterales bacterium]|jgi:predicted ArsR family transcriptional regulator
MPAHASDDPLAQPTRARIVEELEAFGRPVATQELAEALRLHVNGVRRHLGRLRRAGVVERRVVQGERGRPRDEWVLVRPVASGPERQYRDLSRWLARAIADSRTSLGAVEATGREIGRELAPRRAQPATAFREALTALGFEPRLEPGPGRTVRCRLCNCPYAASVRERPDVVCTLHRGITSGLLEALAPAARLTDWEPHDPDRAGCVALLAGTGWKTSEMKEALA